MRPLVLVTGFGPFLDALENPSGDAALLLGEAPPDGIDVAAAVLPVTFEGAPRALADELARLAPRVPDLILSLGLQRQPFLRVESRAKGVLASAKPDGDGRFAAQLEALPEGELRTPVDVARAADLLRAAGGADVRLSDDAGGYVCERTFHAALAAGERLLRPALFLHVPPPTALTAEALASLLRAWLPPLLRELGLPARGAGRKP